MKTRAILLSTVLLMALSAQADELLPKQGVSMTELESIVDGLEINVSKDGILTMSGQIPERCVTDADVKYTKGIDDKGDATHQILMNLTPECTVDFKKKKGENMVALSSLVKPIKLADMTGKLYLHSKKPGDSASKKRDQLDAIMDGKKQVSLKSSEDIAADEAKAAEAERKKANREAQEQAIKDHKAKMAQLCKSGDFNGLREEVARFTDLNANVDEILKRIDKAEKNILKKKLTEAKTGDDAKIAFDNFKAAADANPDWKTAEFDKGLDKEYITKRFKLLQTQVDKIKSKKDDSDIDIEDAIEKWSDELDAISAEGMDDRYKEAFASLYVNLGLHALNNDKSVREAESYLLKAKGIAPASKAAKIDQELANIYMSQLKACIDKNPTRAAACEKQYLTKAEKYAKNYGKHLQNKAAKGDDDASEELAQFQNDYVNNFGAGPTGVYSGYGRSTPYKPGAIEQYKQNAIRGYQQNMMQQMYGGGMMGGGMQQNAAPMF